MYTLIYLLENNIRIAGLQKGLRLLKPLMENLILHSPNTFVSCFRSHLWEFTMNVKQDIKILNSRDLCEWLESTHKIPDDVTSVLLG